MRSPIVVVAVAWTSMSLFGCAPAGPERASAAVMDGTPDWDHLAVGRLAVPHVPNGGCSGTLVGPRVVVTAKHCFAPDQDPTTVWFIGGADPAAPQFLARGTKGFWAGDFEGEWELGDDLYALTLDRVPAGITPMPYGAYIIAPENVGLSIELVGFGYTGPEKWDDGVRRHGFADLEWVGDQYFTTDADWGEVAACGGDSGGAAIWGGTLLGVIARGDCYDSSEDTRVDVHTDVVRRAAVWAEATGGESGTAFTTADGGCSCDRTWSCDGDGSPHGPQTPCPCDPEC